MSNGASEDLLFLAATFCTWYKCLWTRFFFAFKITKGGNHEYSH